MLSLVLLLAQEKCYVFPKRNAVNGGNDLE